ncbi:MAG: acetyltransferase [Gammaproteobacteria bacterium]|nr:acetyltransferase [Gammaproteobacteria bacterium]MDE2345145.1 acetyltransferase [Gammaproteobacteria bacterium]
MAVRGHETPLNSADKHLAAAVRAACMKAAREGYEAAALSGLCHAGAMEASLDAMQRLDLEAVAREAGSSGSKTKD